MKSYNERMIPLKKCFLLLLTVALLCTGVQGDSLADDAVAPCSSNYFSHYGVSLMPGGDGILYITFDVMGMGICTQLGVATYSVERYDEDDGGWDVICDPFNGEVGTNVASYTFSRAFYGISGDTYRVKATFICTMNGGLECKNYVGVGIEVD